MLYHENYKKQKLDEKISVQTKACNEVLNTKTYPKNFNSGKSVGRGGLQPALSSTSKLFTAFFTLCV